MVHHKSTAVSSLWAVFCGMHITRLLVNAQRNAGTGFAKAGILNKETHELATREDQDEDF